MTEHDAIMRQIARIYKPEVLGHSSSDQALIDNLLSFQEKFNITMGEFCYKKDTTDEDRINFIN
jgi:hypothetical protein